MSNESKERKTHSSNPADLPAGEIVFHGDPRWRDWVNSVEQAALASCLQHLSEAGSGLESANQEAVRAITHNLAKLDDGIVALNDSFLLTQRKQVVLASMMANPYFAEQIARIGILLNQLNEGQPDSDFSADFDTIKRIILRDINFSHDMESALIVLAKGGFLNPQNRNDWFDVVIGDALAQTEQPAGYAYRMADIYVKLKQSGLLTGEGAKQNLKALREKSTQPDPWRFIIVMDEVNFKDLSFKQLCFDLMILNYELRTAISHLHQAGLLNDAKGENNLERLMVVGNDLVLADNVSTICLFLNRVQPTCLTQANLNALLNLLENPALHQRVRVISLFMKVKEFESSQAMQEFFTRSIQSLVTTVGEVKKENKMVGGGTQSLSAQRIGALNAQLHQVIPTLPTALLALISAYAGNWYGEEDNKQLLLAQQNVEAQDEERVTRIRQHIQQAVCSGWLGVFAYYIETAHIHPNDVLVEGDAPTQVVIDRLRPQFSTPRLVPIPGNVVLENGVGRLSSYLILALRNNQMDMARFILEYYKNYPSHQYLGINIVEVEWRLSNSDEDEAEEAVVRYCKGSALCKAMMGKDTALVQLLVTNGVNPLCPEYPVGTEIFYY